MKKMKTGNNDMSSTNNDIDLEIKNVFNQHILPRSSNKYLLTGIDKDAPTYYEAPKHPEQAYFSFIDTSSVVGFAEYLSDFWKNNGSDEFAGMSKEISEIAFKLSADSETQSDEVSSFVYTMY